MMSGLQEAFSYCAELVRSRDRDRFIATLFAPASHRDALHALHAFAIEVARVRSLVREVVAGEIRLAWWREVLQRERAGEAKASPVAAALLDTIETYRLPSDPFLGLIEARRFDLYTEPMQTIAQLDDYAAKTSSVLFELAARTLGVGATAAARPAGIAYAVAGLLTTLPRDAARGQLYLPLEVLERHGLGAKDVFTGRSSAPLNAAAADLRDLARRHLDKATQMLGDLPQPALPVFLPAALVRHSLDRLQRSDALAPRVLPQWRRQWLLWRAARKANPLTN